jgi:hypothetical protein
VTWWLKALLAIAAIVAAYFLFGLGLMLKERWFPRRCPRCRWRTLEDVGGARATKVDDQGRRYPDAWTDYKCSQCHALLRLHVGGGWEEIPPIER